MIERGPRIGFWHAPAARAFQSVYPALQRTFFRSSELEFGVEVTHREFAGVDHGFAHHAGLLVGDHLRAAYTQAPEEVA